MHHMRHRAVVKQVPCSPTVEVASSVLTARHPHSDASYERLDLTRLPLTGTVQPIED